MKILVACIEKFITNQLDIKLLEYLDKVAKLDNINDYYDQNVKYDQSYSNRKL